MLVDMTSLLRRVRDHIAAGWCQHAFEMPGRVCLLGAVDYATSHEGDGRSYNAVCAALRRQLPKPFYNLVDFNDNPATTQQDVLALVDRALQEAA